jgi:hypothetical protein
LKTLLAIQKQIQSVLMSDNLSALISNSERLVLINAPAVDIRLPWARWQQPIGLLKIGTYLRIQGYDVRLIDCLQVSANNRLTREKIGQLELEGYHVDLWRFGLSPSKVISRLREWEKQEWKPDVVLVSCGMSFWWQGARNLIALLKSTLNIPIIIGGPYPTFFSEHATLSTNADALFVGDLPEAGLVVPDLTIYNPMPLPRFAGIQLLNTAGALTPSASLRDKQEVVDEVQDKALHGVTTFAFFDSWLGPEHRQPLADTLEEIIARQIPRIHFIAPGNFSPRLIDTNLATLLKQVGFQHIYLHDDILHNPNQINYLSELDDYRNCMNVLHQAGFRPRTDEVGAAVVLGLPGENLDDLTNRLVKLSSIVGSVHLVPFQFTPGTNEGKSYENWLAQHNGRFDPATLNGRTFPLARLAGAPYEDYLEITRLVALLNSKFRSRTFDFLGCGLTAQLTRKSLQVQLWNPFSERASSEERDSFIPLPIKEDR